MQAFRETIAGEFGPVDPSLSGVLGSVFHLHLLNSVEKDLSTFLASDLLNSSRLNRWSRRQGDSAPSSPQAHLLSLSPLAFLRRCFSHPLPRTGWATTLMTTKENFRPMASSRKCSTRPSQTSPWDTATS